VLITRQRVDNVRAIQAERVTPSGSQIWTSIIFLDAQLCPLPHGVTRVCL